MMAGRNGKATQEAPPKEKGDRPIWSRRRWVQTATIEVAIFEKVINEGREDEFIAYNVSAKRTFKDESGEYKSVNGFRQDDLAPLVSLLQQADAHISELLNRE